MNTRFVAAFVLALGSASIGFARADEPTPAPAPSASPASNSALPSLNDPNVQKVLQTLTTLVKTRVDIPINTVHGEVTYFRRFEMQVRITKNGYRNVHLHQGTVINPRGASISNGMTVNVIGDVQPDGSVNANQITVVQ